MVTQVGRNAATFDLLAVGPFIVIAHSFYVFVLIGGGAIQPSVVTIIATIMGVLKCGLTAMKIDRFGIEQGDDGGIRTGLRRGQSERARNHW